LRQARSSGSGAVIDMSMVEANASLLAPVLAEAQLSGGTWAAQGNDHATYLPHGMYATAEEDGWVSVAVRSSEEWCALCRLLDAPEELAALTSSAERRIHIAEIEAVIRAWAGSRTSMQAFQELQRVRVPAAPASGPEELLFDDHIRARETVVDVAHPHVGMMPIYGVPAKGSPPLSRVLHRAPDLDEHREEILTETGYAKAEVEQLIARGAFDD
jgi:crotonobetainyl-CoA:carnitine CoA-transferase CaiB-like acyl-CoA transferase